MREIKFRAWDMDENKMVYPTIQHNDAYVMQLNCSYVGEFNGSKYDTVNMPIMQFTGLKDKHGNEIYEFDILKIDKSHQSFGSCSHKVVEYVNQSGRFHLIGTTYDNMADAIFDLSGKNCSEVIGNRFNNPELL